MQTDRMHVGSERAKLLARLRNERFREAYFEKSLRAYVANQIRALRGDETQAQFGKRIGVSQSMVSERLEDETYGKLTTQTLIDVAKKLKRYLVIKFVDLPTFLQETEDLSPDALVPAAFDERILDKLEKQESDLNLPDPPISNEEPANSALKVFLDRSNVNQRTAHHLTVG
jgi:transcriptional regulator with XRE-family HTH domain